MAQTVTSTLVLHPSTMGTQTHVAGANGTDPTSVAFTGTPTTGTDITGALGTVGLLPVAAPSQFGPGAVLTVGAGGEFSSIGAAVAAAQAGDTILVAAGTYTNDFAVVTKNITLIGTGGMVNMVATVPPPNLKGIITVDASCTIENFTFSGAAISAAAGNNGAGIRYEGGDLVVQNCGFFNNQDGILASATTGLPSNTVTINQSVFDHNGAGDGFSHNIYISTGVDTFTLTNSISENAVLGNEVKSRAAVNIITNNLIQETGSANASYSIDLPDGGVSTISGNTIIQGVDSPNTAILHFGGEGFPYADSSLTVTDNTIINNNPAASSTALLNQTTVVAQVSGNVIEGLTASQIASGPAQETGNANGSGTAFPDSGSTGTLPSNVTIFTDNAPHSVTLSQSGTGVEGGGGLLTVLVQAGHVSVIGGAGGIKVTEATGFGGSIYIDAAGSNNTIVATGQDAIQSRGNDHVTIGALNVTMEIDGHATVQSGSGDNGFIISGTANIIGGSGSDTLGMVSGSAATLTGTEGFVSVTEAGASLSVNVKTAGVTNQFSISGGSAGLTMYNGSAAITTGGGAQGANIQLTAGTFNVLSQAADTIHAGAGTDTLILTGGEQVYAGTGSLAVFGRGISTGASVFGAAGTTTLNGDTGHILYQGGASANTVVDDLASCTVIGGTGHLTIDANAGRLTVTGGAGGISFFDQAGADVITTKTGSVNDLHLDGGSTIFSNGTDLIDAGGVVNQIMTVTGAATISNSGGSSTYTLSGHDKLTSTGSDRVTVTAGAAATVSSSNWMTLTETGATVAFTDSAGNAAATVSGGTTFLSQVAGTALQLSTTGATHVTLGGGAVSIGSGAADTILGGSGSATISLNAANASVTGGSGFTQLQVNRNLTGEHFIGGTGNASVANYGTLNLHAGSGNLTLLGGAGATTLQGSTGSVQATLQGGSSTVIAGKGAMAVNVVYTASATDFSFIAGQGGGSEAITGFRVGVDKLQFSGVSITSNTTSGSNTQVVLSDGTHISLLGVVAQSSALV